MATRHRLFASISAIFLFLLLISPQISRADDVGFSNLGSNDSYIGSCTCGWGIGNGWYGSMAVPFTTSSGGDLSQILIALTSYGGTSATTELVNDNSGVPGTTVLESWSLTGLPGWNSTGTIQPSQTLIASPGVELSGGTQYWLEVLPDSGNFIWMPNNLGQWQVNGQFPSCSNGCSNEYDTQYAPAFEVTTPEPSEVPMAVLGFAAVLYVGWRRRAAREYVLA
ncbi:MAG: choice-of-anchor R domain-containing protein [Terriglobales bacterium]